EHAGPHWQHAALQKVHVRAVGRQRGGGREKSAVAAAVARRRAGLGLGWARAWLPATAGRAAAACTADAHATRAGTGVWRCFPALPLLQPSHAALHSAPAPALHATPLPGHETAVGSPPAATSGASTAGGSACPGPAQR